jgi:hypothetical protein
MNGALIDISWNANLLWAVIIFLPSLLAHELGHMSYIYWKTGRKPKIRFSWIGLLAGKDEHLDLQLKDHVKMSMLGPLAQMAYLSLFSPFVFGVVGHYEMNWYFLFVAIMGGMDWFNAWHGNNMAEEYGEDLQTGTANKKWIEDKWEELDEKGY